MKIGRRKARARRKAGVRYYPAPPRRRASYFFFSFFLTLMCFLSLAGFALADWNSRRVGWNQTGEVFAVSGAPDAVDVTVLGKQSRIALGNAPALFLRARAAAEELTPAPLLAARLAADYLHPPAVRLAGEAARWLLQKAPAG